MTQDLPSPREALALWLAMVAGQEPPGGYLELRLKESGNALPFRQLSEAVG